MISKRRTHFFKASHPLGIESKLDPIWVAKNHSRGIGTTLVLDTNVLINMEKVVRSGNKNSAIKEKGLHNLISLLNRCPPMSISLSPGLAFTEMPPALAEQCRQNYELFCAHHLPQFVDTPDSIQKRYEGKSQNYGFFDLEKLAQSVLAIPFCSLVYLQLIDKMNKLKPIEKFEQYLTTIETELDLLSAKEVEIARYCFANPPAISRQLIEIRRVFRRNFLQTQEQRLPHDAEQLIKIAFNGACDLNLMNSANVMDNKPLDGIQQDCWITTGDEKLVRFAELSHYVNFDGDAGKLAASTVLSEHGDDPYWEQSSRLFQSLSLKRAPHHETRNLDMEKFPGLASRAADLARNAF